ncbi:MAG: hypothetical protein AAF709_25960, partial [Pseudomonadota bacterium]
QSEAPTLTAKLDLQREPVKRSPAPSETQRLTRATAQRTPGPLTGHTSESPGSDRLTEVANGVGESTTRQELDPLAQLPMAIFAASISAAQFFAIQNALYFQAGMREAAKLPKRATQRPKCLSCGACLH